MGKTRKIKLGDIVLPVNPTELEVVMPQLNKRLTLLNMGTVNMKGNRDLVTVTISSFFPGKNSPFYRYADMTPKKYRTKIENWKESKAAKRLIITDMGINLAMLIDKCSFQVKEGSEDIYYTLELSEYRALTVPTVAVPLQIQDNGLKQRPDDSVPAKTHTVGNGDTLWAIAKKYYGNGAQNTQIYAANSAVIEAAAQQHGKSNSNNGWWIYPGTVLAIP